jgi:hypothetical protein
LASLIRITVAGHLKTVSASYLIGLLLRQRGRNRSIPPAPAWWHGRLPKAGENGQICYEVRFIETEADIWRETLRGMLKPLPNQAKIGHWMVD